MKFFINISILAAFSLPGAAFSSPLETQIEELSTSIAKKFNAVSYFSPEVEAKQWHRDQASELTSDIKKICHLGKIQLDAWQRDKKVKDRPRPATVINTVLQTATDYRIGVRLASLNCIRQLNIKNSRAIYLTLSKLLRPRKVSFGNHRYGSTIQERILVQDTLIALYPRSSEVLGHLSAVMRNYHCKYDLRVDGCITLEEVRHFLRKSMKIINPETNTYSDFAQGEVNFFIEKISGVDGVAEELVDFKDHFYAMLY